MRVPRLLAADRFASRLGARLVEAAPERVVVEMPVGDHHRDGSGRVSAGALFSLADCAMSLISNAEATAVAVATHFTRGEDTGGAETITAVATSRLPRGESGAVTWDVVLTADGSLVASFAGTTLRVG